MKVKCCRIAVVVFLAMFMASCVGCGANPAPPPSRRILPQIDSSTGRMPITSAIYDLFTKKGYTGPAPICSKTHGAWLNLAGGLADIVFLAAPTKGEQAYFAEKGVDIEMKLFGFDGLVFLGNAQNPVQNLSADQIRGIYSGRITNWKEVGGEDAHITVFIRNPDSGSQRQFESLVWEGYDMPDFSSREVGDNVFYPESDTMHGVVNEVWADRYAIAFSILSYLDEFENVTLRLFSVDGVTPATENFASGAYPFLTTAYVAIRADEPPGSPARELYDWVGSEESSALIAGNSSLTVTFLNPVIIRAGE